MIRQGKTRLPILLTSPVLSVSRLGNGWRRLAPIQAPCSSAGRARSASLKSDQGRTRLLAGLEAAPSGIAPSGRCPIFGHQGRMSSTCRPKVVTSTSMSSRSKVTISSAVSRQKNDCRV